MLNMSGLERRKAVRVENIQAQFEFGAHTYDVLNISSDGILIGNALGTPSSMDEKVVRKMSAGPFEFTLVDRSGGRMSRTGMVIRVKRCADSILEIAIQFGSES
ncbi:hypothetical protein WDW86_00245 [Bdellovibrionota bacterium FG-2]